MRLGVSPEIEEKIIRGLEWLGEYLLNLSVSVGNWDDSVVVAVPDTECVTAGLALINVIAWIRTKPAAIGTDPSATMIDFIDKMNAKLFFYTIEDSNREIRLVLPATFVGDVAAI